MAKRRNRTFTAQELETELNGVFYASLAHKGARDGDDHDGNAHAGDAHAGDPNAGDAHAGDPNAGNAHAGDPNAGNAHAGETRRERSHLHGVTTLYRLLFERLDDLYYRVGFRPPFAASNGNTPATTTVPKPEALIASGKAFRSGVITLGDPLAMLADHIYRSIAYHPNPNSMDEPPHLPPSTLLRSAGSVAHGSAAHGSVTQGLTDYNDQREGFAVLVTTQGIADKLNRMASDEGGQPHTCTMFIVLEGVDFAPDHCGVVFSSAGGADTAVVHVMNVFYPLECGTRGSAMDMYQHWLSTALHDALADALDELQRSPHVQAMGIVPAGYDHIDLDYRCVEGIMAAACPQTSSSIVPVWHAPADYSVDGCDYASAHRLLSALLSWEMRWLRDGYLEVSPRAFIHPTAIIGKGCRIGSFVHIGAGVRMGEGCVIAASAHIEEGVTLGDFCEIGSGTIIHAAATVGDYVSIHNNVTIGGDGFGFRFIGGEFVKVPQVGSVVIGDSVEIGSGTTIDRGAIRDTIIGDGCKIDNQCHIAHNVVLGKSCVLAGKSAVAGSSTLGDYVMMGGASSIADHITVASGVRLYATASVSKNLTVAGGVYVGTPAKLWTDWSRERVMVSFLARSSNAKILKNIIKKERENYE